MEIRTHRLLLRDLKEDDLFAFHMLQSEPRVTEYTKQGPNESVERSRQMLDDLIVFVNMMRSYESRNQPVLILAITVPPSTELLGLVGTFRPREIGFSLHPNFWARGIAQEATKAFCAWYSKTYPGQQLFAKVNTDNEASVKCLQRCGFSAASQKEDSLDQAYGKDKSRRTWLFRGLSG